MSTNRLNTVLITLLSIGFAIWRRYEAPMVLCSTSQIPIMMRGQKPRRLATFFSLAKTRGDLNAVEGYY